MNDNRSRNLLCSGCFFYFKNNVQLALKKMEFINDDNVIVENKDIIRGGGIFSDCPIGWGGLVRKLFKDIRDVCSKYESDLPLVTQVKSKFGRLSFYLDHEWMKGNSPVVIEVNQLIREAEKRSELICEITGLPGSYFVKDGWYATLNEEKAIELGYKRV